MGSAIKLIVAEKAASADSAVASSILAGSKLLDRSTSTPTEDWFLAPLM